MRGSLVRGVSLIEVLISIVIIVVASIATLTYFGPTRGYIGRSGNRRAALERARERLDQLLAAALTDLPGVDSTLPQNAQPLVWLTCGVSPCSWPSSNVAVAEPVDVEDQLGVRMETTFQWRDDPLANTTKPDTVELGVKVWFRAGSVDDGFNRVYVKTLRTP